MPFFGGTRAVMAEQSSEWEKNRALSVSQGGTGKQIGDKRAQMYLAEGGVLKMQYADYPAMPIADLTGKGESAATVPTGAIFMWMGSEAPTGYVMCDGASYTSLQHPRLFGAIGTQFGQTGGAGTFNVPNLAGRVPVGAGTPDYFEDFGGSLSSGAKGGDVSKELTERHLPEHRHSIEAESLEHSHTVPSHTHARGSLSVAPHTHTLDFTVSDPYLVDESTGAVDSSVSNLSHAHDLDFETSDPFLVSYDADDNTRSVDANTSNLSHAHDLDFETSDPFLVSYDADDNTRSVDANTSNLNHAHNLDFDTGDPFLVSYDADDNTRSVDANTNNLNHDHDPELSSAVTVTSGPKVDSSGSWVASDLKHRHYGIIRGDRGEDGDEFLVGTDNTQGASAIVYSGATPNDWLHTIQDADNPAIWYSSAAGTVLGGGEGLDGYSNMPSTTNSGGHTHDISLSGVSASVSDTLGVNISDDLSISGGGAAYTAPTITYQQPSVDINDVDTTLSGGGADLTGSVDGSVSFAPDAVTGTTDVDYDESDTIASTDGPVDDSGGAHGFTDRYTALQHAVSYGNTGYSQVNTIASYNTDSQATNDAFNDHAHFYYQTAESHSHALTAGNAPTSFSDDSNLAVSYTQPTANTTVSASLDGGGITVSGGGVDYTPPSISGSVSGSVTGSISVSVGASGATASTVANHEHGLEALDHTHTMATDEAVVVTNEHELDHVHSLDGVSVSSTEYELNHTHKCDNVTSSEYELNHTHKCDNVTSSEYELNHTHKCDNVASSETSLRHTHKIDNGTTGNQSAVTYLNAIGATDTPVEADSDDGELTTSTSGGGSISGWTGLAGEPIIEKLDVKQPYLVVNWIMKT